ncbi:MAG: hypothetical protein ACR2G4_09140 [Pyrinomonadaceae bacterium]
MTDTSDQTLERGAVMNLSAAPRFIFNAAWWLKRGPRVYNFRSLSVSMATLFQWRGNGVTLSPIRAHHQTKTGR